MVYTVVFDVSHAGYKSFIFPAFGLFLGAAAAAFVAFGRRLPRWKKHGPIVRVIYPYGLLAFVILWTLVAFVSTYRHYRAFVDALEYNRTQVAEGVVTNFKPMPYSGHAMESFCVSGSCFEYSDYVVTTGFNNTSSHGGPIREGLPVRVTYLGDTILKLEVGK